ncbi:MAG: NTP/NDP exchange transporter [Longimicrobiales bacterium]
MTENAATRLLARVAKVEPEETPAFFTAFLLFFCVLGGYFAVRPVRETVSTILGREATANLFMVTLLASIAIVPIYGALCARFRRSTFLTAVYAIVAIALAGFGLLLGANEGNVLVGKSFFVFISVVNLFMVSVFWSFLLELFNPGQTKRLFGAIAAGGTAGALLGPFLTSLLVESIGNAGILIFGASLFVLAIVFQRILIRIGSSSDWTGSSSAASLARPVGGNPFAGFTLVLRSPYLLGIALFVFLLASATTFLYLEQTQVVRETFQDTEQRTIVFSRIDFTVQSLTILSQIFFTGRLASKFGIGVLITMVPIAMIGGFLALAASGTFAVLVVVMIIRRVGEYAFVKPAREMLFSRVDTETKYKAKNLVDVPVYRGGDALVGQVDNALTGAGWSGSAIALVGAVVAFAWAVNGFILGRARREAEAAAPSERTGLTGVAHTTGR